MTTHRCSAASSVLHIQYYYTPRGPPPEEYDWSPWRTREQADKERAEAFTELNAEGWHAELQGVKFWFRGAALNSQRAMTPPSASTVSTKSRTRSRRRSGGNGNGSVKVASAAMDALASQMEALAAQRKQLALGGDGPAVSDGDGMSTSVQLHR